MSVRVQPGEVLYYLFLSSRLPASHINGYCVLGGVWDNITHLDAFLLNQAPLGILFGLIFGKLEDIFGNPSFPPTAKFWKPLGVKGDEL